MLCVDCAVYYSLVGCLPRYVQTAVYYRVWQVVYHAMCRLCCLLKSGGLLTTLCVDYVH